jgi:hypothetical protein
VNWATSPTFIVDKQLSHTGILNCLPNTNSMGCVNFLLSSTTSASGSPHISVVKWNVT